MMMRFFDAPEVLDAFTKDERIRSAFLKNSRQLLSSREFYRQWIVRCGETEEEFDNTGRNVRLRQFIKRGLHLFASPLLFPHYVCRSLYVAAAAMIRDWEDFRTFFLETLKYAVAVNDPDLLYLPRTKDAHLYLENAIEDLFQEGTESDFLVALRGNEDVAGGYELIGFLDVTNKKCASHRDARIDKYTLGMLVSLESGIGTLLTGAYVFTLYSKVALRGAGVVGMLELSGGYTNRPGLALYLKFGFCPIVPKTRLHHYFGQVAEAGFSINNVVMELTGPLTETRETLPFALENVVQITTGKLKLPTPIVVPRGAPNVDPGVFFWWFCMEMRDSLEKFLAGYAFAAIPSRKRKLDDGEAKKETYSWYPTQREFLKWLLTFSPIAEEQSLSSPLLTLEDKVRLAANAFLLPLLDKWCALLSESTKRNSLPIPLGGGGGCATAISLQIPWSMFFESVPKLTSSLRFFQDPFEPDQSIWKYYEKETKSLRSKLLSSSLN